MRAVTLYLTIFSFIFLQSADYITMHSPIPVPTYINLPKQYNHQIWGISQSPRGKMFFATSEGIITYNGNTWNKINNFPYTTIHSLYSISNDTLLIGGIEFLGLCIKTKNQKWIYKTIATQSLLERKNFWKINQYGNRFIASSTYNLFDITEDFQLDTVYQSSSFAHVSDNNLYFTKFIPSSKKHLLITKSNLLGINQESSLPFFLNMNLQGVVNLPLNTLLIATSTDGIYLMKGDHITPWGNDLNNQLKRSHVNSVIKLGQEMLAFATRLNGVYISDYNGKIVYHLTEDNILDDNTILSMYYDKKEKTLWIGQDNGITCVPIYGNLLMHLSSNNKIGSMTGFVKFKNQYFISSNRGIFFSDPENDALYNSTFSLDEQLTGYVGYLKQVDDELFCGSEHGTFIYRNKSWQKISDVQGATILKKYDENTLIEATWSGLVLYTKKQSNWKYSHTITNLFNISGLSILPNKEIWISSVDNGVYRLSLNDSLKLNDITHIRTLSKVNADIAQNITTSIIQKQLVLSDRNAFYFYNMNQDEIEPFNTLNQYFDYSIPQGEIQQSNNQDFYWFINKQSIKLYHIPKKFSAIQQKQEVYLPYSYSNEKCGITEFDNKKTWIYGRNKLFSYTPLRNNSSPLIERDIQFEDISFSSSENKIYIKRVDSLITIPYDLNNFNISFYNPNYTRSHSSFSYFLNGYDKSWHQSEVENNATYQNLPSGNYTFMLKNANGQSINFTFTITPPWYYSIWAIITYVFLFLLMVGLIIYLFEEQQKVYRHEINLVKQTQNLEKELLLNSNELTATSKQLAGDISVFEKIDYEIKELSKHVAAENVGYVKRIRKLADKGLSNRRVNILEENIFVSNGIYFDRLKKRFPKLTKNDLKLCAYTKMNLSTKEVANLMHITPHSVEVARSRLRKKINAPKGVSLYDILRKYF